MSIARAVAGIRIPLRRKRRPANGKPRTGRPVERCVSYQQTLRLATFFSDRPQPLHHTRGGPTDGPGHSARRRAPRGADRALLYYNRITMWRCPMIASCVRGMVLGILAIAALAGCT